MKIIARQVDPSAQTSPFEFYAEDYPPESAVFGNRWFYDHIPDHVQEAMDDVNEDDVLYTSKAKELDAVAALLTKRTGHEWKWREIHGTCQGDWQNLLYDTTELDDTDITRFEAIYFDTGTEWCVEEFTDDEEIPEDPADIDGAYTYCTDCDTNAIRLQIAQEYGASPEDVVLYEFNGYTRHAKYKLV